jgi:hypothetical protein
MKKSTLAAGLEAAAGKTASSPEIIMSASMPARTGQGSTVTVMIGAHYPKEVRRALKMVEADTGRKLKPLLGEAINDLCAKYGKPQPYNLED